MKIDKKNMTGSIQLSSAHSIILGHKPSMITPELLSKQLCSENNKTNVEKFGLWEVASPNYSTYYPDVTAEDLKPQEVDFIEPVFRLLSETTVSKGYRPIDFSKKDVLKKSMPMLLGQTINIDHEVAVGNAIGAVSEVYWQQSYKTKTGVIVPAGINGVMKIDGKSNPRIARGIMMEPPSIHSNSVTVRFKWEPSHKFEDISEFYNLLGSYDKDGEMYRLVVNEVLGYSETSLVSHGADVWAQKIKEDGEINNPEYASRQSFSADGSFEDMVGYDFKEELIGELNLEADENTIPIVNNNNKHKSKLTLSMNKLIEKFVQELGFNEGELNEENLISKVKETLTTKEQEITQLKTDKDTLSDEITQLTTKNTTLETENSSLKGIGEQTRTEAKRLYQLSQGDKADTNILSLLENAELPTVTSLLKQYQKEVEEKFTESCQDCGSKNVTRATAKTTKEGLVTDPVDTEEVEGGKPKTSKEVLSALKGKKKKKSLIFKTE